MQPEIQAYFESVARKYDIVKHVTFRTVVDLATWEEETATWLVTVRDLTSKQTYQRRCKILVSAVGALSIPKKCDIPGASVFRGKMFHSAEWDHSFDWKDREVVTIGLSNTISIWNCSDLMRRQWLQCHSVRACH